MSVLRNSILLLVVPLKLIYAQPVIQVHKYSTNDGLSQSNAEGFLQDERGFIWIHTWNGLNRFDGYTFKNYKSYPQDSPSLLDNRISEIHLNKYGNLWCKSYSGQIYLFDTRNEKFIDLFHPVMEKTNHKLDILDVIYFKTGVLWIITRDGKYNIRVAESKRISDYTFEIYDTENSKLKSGNILNIVLDKEGDEWVFTDKGPFVIGSKKIESTIPFHWLAEVNGKKYLASKNGEFAVYVPLKNSADIINPLPEWNQIYVLTDLGNSKLGIGTDNGLYIYDVSSENFQHYNIKTRSQKSNDVLSIYKDIAGDLWLFTNDIGVVRLNVENDDAQHFMYPKDKINITNKSTRTLIHEDPYGNLSLMPKGCHFCYFDRKTGDLKYYLTDPGDTNSKFLPDMQSYNYDRRGFLWYVPYNEDGIANVTFLPSSFKFSDMSSGKEIRSMLNDKDNTVWIGEKFDQIALYDSGDCFLGFLHEDGSIKKKRGSFVISPYCMFQDDDHTIWIGTRQKGLYILKKKTAFSYTIHHYANDSLDPYSLNNNRINSIFRDSRQNIWIGTYGGGLNLVKTKADGKIRFINKSNDLKGYPKSKFSRIRYISESDDSVIMIATTEGLLTYSAFYNSPEKITFYQNEGQRTNSSSLSANDIMHIYQDSRGNIYLCTSNGGINRIVSDNLLSDSIAFQSYTVRDGLASDITMSMLEDNNKNLWIVSENGLTRFNPDHKSFENFSTPFLHQSYVLTEALPIRRFKDFVFATENGIVMMNPYEIKNDTFIPPMAFTSIIVQSNNSKRKVNSSQKIVIYPHERNIIFHFAAFDFIDPDRIEYAWRLEGFENDWNYEKNNRSANYLNLKKGEYTFMVKSTNSDGVWVDNTKALSISVIPTFWETRWAWLVYFLGFITVLSITVYIFIYIYRLRNQVNIEKQLSQMKLQFFTDVSHELRTPITLISNPITEILEKEELSKPMKESLLLVQSNTNRLLRLINQILDFRKVQTNKMKVVIEYFDGIRFIEKITNDFSHLAKEKQIKLNFYSDLAVFNIYSDKDKLEKIFYNLLSNAIKFTPKGKNVFVKISRKDNNFIIIVKDEGIGISKTKLDDIFQRFETIIQKSFLQPSTGIGLSLVKEMVQLLHGTVEVKSEPGKGTEFKVIIPTERSNFENDPLAEFILDDGAQILAESIEVSEEFATTDKIVILVVEDNAELRQFIKKILKDDYQVFTSVNGMDGYKKALDVVPDIIISDVMMPVMDGLEMVQKIKQENSVNHIPIIILSAKSTIEDRIKGLEYGIDEYLPKPFSSKYLKAKISSIIGQRKFLKEYYLELFTKRDRKQAQKLELTPSVPKINPVNDHFIQKVMEYIENNIESSDIKIDDFAKSLSLGRTKFYKKLKSIIGLSPVDFILEMRIKRAIQLMEAEHLTFSEIAYKVGFNEPAYFSKCFKKYTGMTPTEYRDKMKG
ncbi:MAG: response regulator [Bacteroidales bacterium]|nr:response regulator [Bacteroidales bacterium]